MAKQAKGKAKKAVKKGKSFPNQTSSPKQLCPLQAAKAAKAKKASKQIGKNKANKSTLKNSKTSTAGCPISMVTGEELLMLEDFAIDGPFTLPWTRFYRSGQSGVEGLMGHGWLTPLDEWLEVSEDLVVYHDSEGRDIPLPLPELGEYSLNLPERLRLHRDDGQFRLVVEEGVDRVFADGHGRCRLTGWRDKTGQSIELIYDVTGLATALKSSWGKVLAILWEGRRIVAIAPARLGGKGYEAAAAPLVRYQYDESGMLAAVSDRLGHGERYTYRDNMLVGRTLASGFSFHFEWDQYNSDGRCVHTWGDGGIYAYRFEWTDSGISRATDALGGVTEYMHDANALLLWQTSPEGRTIRFAYNRDNLLHCVTDNDGHSTTYEYDDEGRLAAVTGPLGQTSRLTYNEDGKPITLTDPLGQIWRREYDGQGKLAITQNPLGGATRFAYNELGLPTLITNALGQTRKLLWDEQGRLVEEQGFDGIKHHYQYDADDRIIVAVTQDKLISHYQYDAANRIIAVKNPDGAVVKLQYNAAGMLTHYIDAAGHTTEYRYGDGLPQITERIDPAGQTLRYQYDSLRRLVGLINAKGEKYQLEYDKDEKLVQEVGFDGRIQRYQYGLSGFLQAYAQCTDTSWLLTRYERDPLGRLLKRLGPSGETSQFGYDPLGRLEHAQNADSHLHFHYDALGKLVAETQNAYCVRHEYDGLGRRTATLAPDGRRIEYTRDTQGRVQSIQLDGQILTRHRFDDLGLENARQQGDLVSRYDYDPMGRLKHHQAGFAGNPQVMLRRSYGYDATGKLNAVDDFLNGQTHYRYDPADRLIQVDGISPERFVYDPAGNLVGVNQASGQAQGDRLLSLADYRFIYDSAGNLVEKRRGMDSQAITRYRYDSDNRLIRVETPDGVSEYRYDPLGRRMMKTTPQGETQFVYDGAKLLVDIVNGRHALYVYEQGGFRPLVRADRAENGEAVYHYHLDHLGTPREMTDAQGQIVWSAKFKAYGALLDGGVRQISNPLRFQGQYHDIETGLHYNLNRYYDAEIGRYITHDPIGLEGGSNFYSYVYDNPTCYSDPTGLDVYVENTAQVGGWHQKIVVDTPDGQYGQSFGMSSRDLPEQGFYESLHEDPAKGKAGSGVVYSDSDPITKIKRQFKTTAEEDAKILVYLQNQLGNTGPYNWMSNNCRDYSNNQFSLIVTWITNDRAPKTGVGSLMNK